MKKRIKAVIFDIGGVLALNKNPTTIKRGISTRTLGIHQYIAKKLNLSLDQWFDSADEAYIHSFEGTISYKKTLDIISKNTKTPNKKLRKILVTPYKKNFKQNTPLHKLAIKLKKQGYKIAVLSDQWHPSKEAVVLKKYYKKFNVVILSCDVGFRKPDIRIYKLTLKKLKLKPNQVIFIDNQIWNIKPAKKLGMKTILFRNNRQTIKEMKKLGVSVL